MSSPELGSGNILGSRVSRPASLLSLGQAMLDEMRSLNEPLWTCHHSHCVSVCLPHFLMEKLVLSD